MDPVTDSIAFITQFLASRARVKNNKGRDPFSVHDITNRTQASKPVPMPARGYKRGRTAPSRRSRKAPRAKKTYKRKATIRKSTKRKKRKVSTRSKSVGLTVGTARQRRVEHYKREDIHTAYVAFSSVGETRRMLKMVAQAMLLHYMHRVGDYRASKTMIPVTNATTAAPDATDQVVTWEDMKFSFIVPNIFTSNEAVVADTFILSCLNGGAYASLTVLTDNLANELYTQFNKGRRLSQVTVFRGFGTNNVAILQDISAGRNVIEFSSKATLKLQNTTDADSPGADNPNVTANVDHRNMMNIHRNPVDGLKYTFRNKVPLFKLQYLVSKIDQRRDVLDGMQNSITGDPGGVNIPFTITDEPEFMIPPPVPSTIFKNVTSKERVSIQPGGHKSFSLSEFYSGPINSFADRYFQRLNLDAATNSCYGQGAFPPGGTCCLIGLKPTYRTSGTEDVRLECEMEYIQSSRMTRAKLTPLPMSSYVE
jgi:hypothetical protein